MILCNHLYRDSACWLHGMLAKNVSTNRDLAPSGSKGSSCRDFAHEILQDPDTSAPQGSRGRDPDTKRSCTRDPTVLQDFDTSAPEGSWCRDAKDRDLAQVVPKDYDAEILTKRSCTRDPTVLQDFDTSAPEGSWCRDAKDRDLAQVVPKDYDAEILTKRSCTRDPTGSWYKCSGRLAVQICCRCAWFLILRWREHGASWSHLPFVTPRGCQGQLRKQKTLMWVSQITFMPSTQNCFSWLCTALVPYFLRQATKQLVHRSVNRSASPQCRVVRFGCSWYLLLQGFHCCLFALPSRPSNNLMLFVIRCNQCM